MSITTPGAPLTYTKLQGSERQLLPNSRAAGPVDPNERIAVTIRVRCRASTDELEQEVAGIYARPLADRVHLTRDALAQRFGAAAEDLDKVEELAETFNLVVARRSPAERTITLRGRLSDLLAAFPQDLQLYHHNTGTYRGRRGAIAMPSALEGVITGVFGFDNRPKRRVSRRRHRSATAAAGTATFFTPVEFAQRYNFPTEANGATIDGTGQTIAIVELGGGYRRTDLTAYFAYLKVPAPHVTSVSVDHARNSPTGDPNGDDGEVVMDIQVAGAVAPGARIVVYFAPNQGNGLLDAISAAIHDDQRKPSVVSISWGEPEEFITTQGLQAYHEEFLAAAAAGITITVATGDHGTADLREDDWKQPEVPHKQKVDHPASDPYVLACGGTQIEGGVDVVWNDGTTLADGGWATGGGISTKFAVPAWQASANKVKSQATGKPGRGIPDLCASALQYLVLVDGNWNKDGGGTSAVAPLLAGMVALLNQAKGKRVGWLNPFLYQHASKGITKDVTSGNNGIAGTVTGYAAGAGWDPASGLGTPDGQKILQLL